MLYCARLLVEIAIFVAVFCMLLIDYKQHLVRPNKKISVFRVTGLTILVRVVGTHIFSNHFFLEKYNFMHFERRNAFQNA